MAGILKFAGLCLSVMIMTLMAGPTMAATQCPDNFVAFRGTTAPLPCFCPAENTGLGGVWGMDVYTEDSGICNAAVHAGVITPNGGDVMVQPMPGQKAYPGVTRNGVTSSNNGAMDGSFSFISNVAPAVSPAQSVSQCPDNFVAFRGTTAPLTCACPEGSTGLGAVWGMDVYTEDSGICIAAVHAGVISDKGGTVTVQPLPGQNAYPGVTRNGVTSSNNGAMDGSFSFTKTAAMAPAVAPVPTPVQTPVATGAASQCPDNFVAFRGTTAPLTCACPEVNTSLGAVWGMDIYTEDSGICIAAVHAGVISDKGGTVTVQPLPGQKAYPGVTRNGVTSSNNGAMDGSFSVSKASAVAPVAAPAAAPVQAAIAQSLEQTGQVQLYINFATGSDRLYDESIPVLNELLQALRSSPGLKLALIGHTDNVGGTDYNLSLSSKRAEAVKFWLIQKGVLPSRLETAGRGESEPLDDNASEYGRAVNRRVQAVRIQ